jgi:hypothetical protein
MPQNKLKHLEKIITGEYTGFWGRANTHKKENYYFTGNDYFQVILHTKLAYPFLI